MRILALIGAALVAAAFGALLAFYKRDRPQPAPAETVISYATSNGALQVPLPAGFCGQAGRQRNPPPDREQDAEPDAPSDGLRTTLRVALLARSAPPLRRDQRVVAVVPVRPVGAAQDLARLSRPPFLARIADRVGDTDTATLARPGIGGRSLTVAPAGQDDSAFRFRVAGLPAGSGDTACGVIAVTLAGGTLVIQLMIEHCDSAPIEHAILPPFRHLASASLP